MHFLYFTVIDKADNSDDAKDQARTALDVQGFAGDQGYFSGSKADWYVIGGRWSGYLQTITLKQSPGKDFFKLADKLFENPKWITQKEIDKRQNELQQMWEKIGGKFENPYNRDSYERKNYEDDARVIDIELLGALKKQKKVEVFLANQCEETLANELDKEVLGKWIVVIDYHN